MTNDDKLDLLQRHVELADAVARAIAYNSPSAIEEYRSGVNRELLDLRAEVDPEDPKPDTDPQPEPVPEVPAAQEDVQLGEPVAAEPGVVEQAGEAPAPVADEPAPPEAPAA